MRTKHLVLVVAIVLAAFMQLQAQPAVETINVDTLVYLGKGVNGEAGGALFLPDGNIIALWKGIPIVLDSKSGEIIRQLEPLSSGYPSSPELTKDGTKLVTTRSGPKLAIWDVLSGKVIFQPDDDYKHFCLSPDGTKLYVTKLNEASNPGVISVIDMATLKETERFFDLGLYAGSYIAISPDGQTLALSAFKEPDNEYDTKTNQVILIDLKDKTKYTTLETFDPQVNSMEFSPDGKQIAFLHYGQSLEDVYIYIYNLETKEKKFLRVPELSLIFNINCFSIGEPHFIDNNIIFSGVRDLSGNHRYSFTWNIAENRVKNLINFIGPVSVVSNENYILFCNGAAVIGLTNKQLVNVNEPNSPIMNIKVQCTDSCINISSSIEKNVEIEIFDYKGNKVYSRKDVILHYGDNKVPILPAFNNGVYFCNIITESSSQSYKFIISK